VVLNSNFKIPDSTDAQFKGVDYLLKVMGF